MNELEARFSPNPIFTALLQDDGPESAARQLFGQLEVGHPVRPVVIEQRPVPGSSGETLVFQMSESRMPALPAVADDMRFPYRASAQARVPRPNPDDPSTWLSAPAPAPGSLAEQQWFRDHQEEIEEARASAALAAAIRHQQATVVDEDAAHQARLDELGPVVVAGLISTTPTGSINLRLRKPEAGQ